jgi:hypothetical protein
MSISIGAEYPTAMQPSRALVRRRRTLQRARVGAILVATMLVTAAASDRAFAQNCNGPCPFDRLFLPITAAGGDENISTGKTAKRDGASPSWNSSDRGSAGSTPRWTVSIEAIVLARTGGVDQTLVGRVPGSTQWTATNTPGVEALNSNQLDGVSAGPKVSLLYRGDAGLSAEFSYFNIFTQGATKTIGPTSPADWLVMQAPGTFWQTQDWAYQGMTWASATKLYSAEANGRLDLSEKVTVLAGLRWLRLKDSLQGTLTPADLMEPDWKPDCTPNGAMNSCQITQLGTGSTPAGYYPPFWTTTATNNLYGAQVGVHAKLLEVNRLSLDGQLKAGLYDNHATQTTVVSMRKLLFPSGAATDRLAFAGELDLQLKYRVTPALTVKFGYEALWLAGVALAPGQIQQTYTTPSSVTALGVNSGSQVLFQGATAGLEYSF